MINRRNYRWVKEFLDYLVNVRRLSEESTRRYRSYLRWLLLWAAETPLSKAAGIDPPFGRYVSQGVYSRGQRDQIPLGAETQKKIIETARSLFRWAKMYDSRAFLALPAYWVNDLIPPKILDKPGGHIYVSLEEIVQLSRLSDDREDLALWRDQASAAFLFLSGMRAHAFTTLPIAAVSFERLEVYQWPKEFGVKTKGSQTATTTLLPIPDLVSRAQSWDRFLRENVPSDLWSAYPWYAPIAHSWGDHSLSFDPPGENRREALNKRLHLLWSHANLQGKSSHKFRHGHAVYGVERCRTMAEYQAVSHNLMHKSIAITDKIYAGIELAERKKLIAGLSAAPADQVNEEMVAYFSILSRSDLKKAIQLAAELLVR